MAGDQMRVTHRAFGDGERSAAVGWVLPHAIMLVTAFLLAAGSRDFFSNDTAQALSVIGNLLSGHGIKTSAVYYDTQAMLGMPAPQLIWPPALPVLAAAIAWLTGLSGERALILIDAVAHAATALLLYWLVARLRPARYLPAIIAIGFLCHFPVLQLVLAGGSEALFLLASLASAACVLQAAGAKTVRSEWIWWLAAALCVALGTLVRYPAIFQIGAVGLVALVSLSRRKPVWLAAIAAAAACLPAIAVFLALVARNLALTGRITGAAGGPRPNSLSELLFQAKWAMLHLFGFHTSVIMKLALIACLTMILAWAVMVAWQARTLDWRPVWPNAAVAGYATISAVMTTAVIVAMAARSVFTTLETRYFMLPALMAVLALVALWPRPLGRPNLSTRAAMLATGLVGAVWLAGQLAEIRQYVRSDRQASVMRRALQHDFAGTTVEAFLRASTSLSSPVLSNQSQSLFLVLDRPTFGVPEYRLTPRSWSGEAILAEARRLGVKHVLIFRRIPLGDADGGTDYVWQMAKSARRDLVPLVVSDDIALYQIAP